MSQLRISDTMTTPLMVDLCSGYGGASEPARARGWRVVKLDIAIGAGPDVVADIRALPLRCHPDFLWVSPPCQEFTAAALPWRRERLNPRGPQRGIELMRAAIIAVHALQPAVWVIENVPAAVKWCGFLGLPTARTWGHVFWSNVFPLLPQVAPHKMHIPGNCSFTHWKRSVIPFGVAHAWTVAAESAVRVRE